MSALQCQDCYKLNDSGINTQLQGYTSQMYISEGVSVVKLMLSLSLVLASAQAWSDSVAFKTDVTRVLVHSSKFGQCMARVTEDIPTRLPSCNSGWVTFDCGAELPGSSRMNSSEKFNVAKTALVMGRSVYLEVIDDQSINGYCLAQRIDLY